MLTPACGPARPGCGEPRTGPAGREDAGGRDRPSSAPPCPRRRWGRPRVTCPHGPPPRRVEGGLSACRRLQSPHAAHARPVRGQQFPGVSARRPVTNGQPGPSRPSSQAESPHRQKGTSFSHKPTVHAQRGQRLWPPSHPPFRLRKSLSRGSHTA